MVCRSDDRFSVLVPEVRRLCHHQTLLGGDTDAQENLGDEVDLLLSILAFGETRIQLYFWAVLFSTRRSTRPWRHNSNFFKSAWASPYFLGYFEALPKGAHLLAQIESP